MRRTIAPMTRADAALRDAILEAAEHIQSETGSSAWAAFDELVPADTARSPAAPPPPAWSCHLPPNPADFRAKVETFPTRSADFREGCSWRPSGFTVFVASLLLNRHGAAAEAPQASDSVVQRTMANALSLCLFAAAALGLLALSVQLWLTTRHLRGSKPLPRSCPPISILKPLCGLDDALEENLLCFLDLGYPSYEVVLGLKDHRDPAFGLALRLTRKHPARFRLVLQRGEPGHNPKVNQLVTLAEAARHDILVISDSNARVGRGYLSEMAALFEDPSVGCVTNPIVGFDERRWGSLLDNLHMSSSVGPGMIGAKLFAGQDLVVGKSMALRRADLERLGGFRAVADILAEDYVLGKAVSQVLGMRVALARTLVMSVSRHRSIHDFWRRYARWSVIHRTALSAPTYVAQVLLNPIPLAGAATLIEPTRETVIALLGVTLAKTAIDVTTASALGHRFGRRLMPAVVLKDLILFASWARAFFVRTVEWRGNQLRVRAGSRLDAEPAQQELEILS